MGYQHEVELWIDRLKKGDERAIGELWTIYACRLQRLARQHLASRFRRASDEDDVVTQVFWKLWKAVGKGRYSNVSTGKQIWSLFRQMTINQCQDQIRYETRQRRCASASSGADVSFDERAVPVNCGPTPGDVMVREELVNQFRRGLDPDLDSLMQRRLTGHTIRDLARQEGCSARTVERRLKHLRNEILEFGNMYR